MTITLESIEEQHQRVAAMIAAFKAQPQATEFHISALTIPLAAGEKYAGLILGEAGETDYHLVLLAGEAEDVTWEDAGKWANGIGGQLPSRREQSLLFANSKGEFQSSYYWSAEQHESNSGWAWFQYFGLGYQNLNHKYSELRARAVRRLVIF